MANGPDFKTNSDFEYKLIPIVFLSIRSDMKEPKIAKIRKFTGRDKPSVIT